MATWRDFRSPEADSYLSSTVSKFQSRAAQRIAGNVLQDDVNEQARQQARAAEEAERVRREQERQAEQMRKDQEQAAKDAEARRIRAAEAAGAKIETDIETGRRTVATHADGAPKFKPGPVGEPVETPTINREMNAIPGLGAVVDSGALGVPADRTGTGLVQTYRDDRGREFSQPLPTKTDPKTAEIYRDVKNPTTGLEERRVLGVDQEMKAKIDRSNKIAADLQNVTLARNAYQQQRAAFEPRWQPVKAEYLDAESELKKLADPSVRYQRRGNLWAKINEETGAESIATDEEVRRHQQRWEQANARMARAKAAYEPLAPQAEALTKRQREIEMRRLQLAEQKIRLDAGLPDDDGGTAGILAKAEGVVDDLPNDEIVREAVGAPAAPEQPTADGPPAEAGQSPAPPSGSEPAPPADKPLLPDNPDKVQLFASAFSGLAEPEKLSLGQSGQGYQFIKRDGRQIGSIDTEENGASKIILSGYGTADDLQKIASLGGTNGVPVYLADSAARKSLTDEAAWTAKAFQTAGTRFADDDDEDSRLRMAAIREQGADWPTLVRKAKTGEISMQTAEALARDLYKTTLKAENPDDPALMDEFFKENPDMRAAWRRGGSGGDIAARNAVRNQFVNWWYVRNKDLPGVTRSAQAEARKRLAGEKQESTTGKVFDALDTTGAFVRDTAASMAGLLAKYPALGALSAGGLVSEDWRQASKEAREVIGRANENWLRGIEHNRQKWFTDNGKHRLSAFEKAGADLRSLIESAEDTGSDSFKKELREAIQAHAEAAFGVHQLNQEDGWEMTLDDLDPEKDKALGSALIAFKETGDPAMWDSYVRRMLLDKGTRQADMQMMQLTEGMSPGAAAFTAGLYATDAEALVEIASTALTFGASKAISAGAKLARIGEIGAETAGAATRLSRTGRFFQTAKRDFQALGKVEDTLAKPANRIGKARNAAVDMAKAAPVEAIGEGFQGGMIELGNREATPGTLIEQAGMEALGGLVMLPVMAIPGQIAGNVQAERARRYTAGKFSEWYNRAMADTPGFSRITPDKVELAAAIINPEEHAAKVQAMTESAAELRDAAAELGGVTRGADAMRLSDSQRTNLEGEAARIQRRLDEDSSSDQTGRGALPPARRAALEEQLQDIESRLADADVDVTQTPPAARYSNAVARFYETAADTERSAVGMVEAVQYADKQPASTKDFLLGVLKVANGREALLTSTERAAVAGKATADGKPYFASVGGKSVLTDAARAELMADHPLIGSRIQTTESRALLEQSLASPSPTPAQSTNDNQTRTETAPLDMPVPEMPTVPDGPTPPGDGGARPGTDGASGTGQPGSQPTDGQATGGAGSPDGIADTGRTGGAAGAPEGGASDAGGTPAQNQAQPDRGDAQQPQAEDQAEAGEAAAVTHPEAQQAIERAEKKYPGIKGKIRIIHEPEFPSAFFATPDGVFINTAFLDSDLANFEGRDRAARADAAIDEEIVHFAGFQHMLGMAESSFNRMTPEERSLFVNGWFSELPADRQSAIGSPNVDRDFQTAFIEEYEARLWREFTPDQQRRIAETYQGNFDSLPDAAKGGEAIRIVTQIAVRGNPTEAHNLFSSGKAPILKNLLREAIAFLKQLVGAGEVSPTIQKAIDGFTAMLDSLRGEHVQKSARSEQVAGDVSKNPGKVSTSPPDEVPSSLPDASDPDQAAYDEALASAERELGVENAAAPESPVPVNPPDPQATQSGSLREILNSSFQNPPSTFNLKPADENELAPAARETLRELRLSAWIPGDVRSSERGDEAIIERRTGTRITYYSGGDPSISGFTPPSRPSLIFVNKDRADVPASWTISHEITHVAQKDAGANSATLDRLILDHLSPREVVLVTSQLQKYGYRPEQFKTELPAFLVADAVSGHSIIGLDDFARGKELRTALVEWFDGLGQLNPSALPDAPDADLSQQIDKAASETETSPTEGQKEAGNYRKGQFPFKGLTISIENPRGSVRSGTDSKGNEWSVELAHHYGYFRRTEGKDGDQVDVFIGPDPESDRVFVVNQINPQTGRFDEHKVMVGFNSRREAIEGYKANYSPGWKGLGDIVETDVSGLKDWLENGDLTRRASSSMFDPEEEIARIAPAKARATPDKVENFKLSPVVSGIIRAGGMQSWSAASRGRSAEWVDRNRSNWDDRIGLPPAFNAVIYSPSSVNAPDKIAQALATEGIGDGTVNGLWSELERAANSALDRRGTRDSRQDPNRDWTDAEIEQYLSTNRLAAATPSDGSVRRFPVSIPDAIIAHDLGSVRNHRAYEAAKHGDPRAALEIAREFVTSDLVEKVRGLLGGQDAIVVPVLAIEQGGRNMIPNVAAEVLADRLGILATQEIVQVRRAHRGNLSGLDRIFSPSGFGGPVESGRNYLLVDDTLTQGGTFAALADHITAGGGRVIGAVALTGKQYSAKLAPSDETVRSVREQFGDVEDAFRRATGYGFDRLTESEARSLVKFKPSDAVRRRILKEGNEGRSGVDPQGTSEGPRLSAADPGSRDNEYLAAVERGDMATAQRMADEKMRERGYSDKDERTLSHRAPNREDDNLATIKDSGLVPDDYWTHPHYYIGRSDNLQMQAHRAVSAVLNKNDPDAKITIYRAIPKHVAEGAARNGDRVTPVRAYADNEAKLINGGGRIIKQTVRIGDLWWDGNSIAELGYDDGKSYVYLNTKNNRKLNDPVTYDSEGKVIPLSQRFNPDVASILYAADPASSSSSIPQQIIDDALRPMSPMHRAVFEESLKDLSVFNISRKFNISEKAVTNIMQQVHSRIRILSEAARGEIKAERKDGKIVPGRPDVALSTNEQVARAHQIREQDGGPGVLTFDEVFSRARATVAKDFQGTLDGLIEKRSQGVSFNLDEIAQAKTILMETVLRGEDNTPEMRMKMALLATEYIDQGTDDARRLAFRRDPNLTPAQRHAQYLAEMLYTPDKSTRDALKGANKVDREAMIARWSKQVDTIKRSLKNQGIDIDATLEAFREREQQRREFAAERPRASAVLEEQVKALSPAHRAVMQALMGGSKLDVAAEAGNISYDEAKQVLVDFRANTVEAMRKATRKFIDAAMALSAADPSALEASILAEFGIPSLEDVDVRDPSYEKRQKEKAKARRQEAEKQRKEREKLAAPPTPEQQAKWDKLAEEFFARPMSTWRTLWQDEMKKLDPVRGGNFDFKEGELIQPWKDLWQTEMPGVAWSEPKFKEWAGAEPARKQAVMDLFKAKLNELRGTWQRENADFLREQGELLGGHDYRGKDSKGPWQVPAQPINETTGTFDLADPVAMKAVVDAFAIARGSKMDAVMEFWRSSILTGPQTHIVNVASNVMAAAFDLMPRRAVEATINNILGLVGQGDSRSATFAEFVPMAKNLRRGIQLAARNALRSWKLENRTFEAYARAEPIQLDFTGVGTEYIPPALGGKIGKVMRSLSFRAMTAADEFMKSIYAQMEAAAQAHRIAAVEEKLKGPAYEARLEQLMQPGSEAWLRAVAGAQRVTFQEEMDGKDPRLIRRIDQLAELAKNGRAMPWIGRPLTFFLPFIDTPTNIFKQAVEITPIGGFLSVVDGMRALRRRIYSGNISKEAAKQEAEKLYDRARFVRDLTNQTIAWSAFFALQGLAAPEDDEELPVITGTVPYKTTKRGERDNTYAVMPPMTIRLGDLQFSYQRFEPFATALASVVDLHAEMKKQGGFKPGVVSSWLARFKDQVKDKTFLQGLSNLLNAVEDPERFGERLTANIVTGFVPNVIRQPLREADTMIRDQNPRPDDGFFTSVAKSVGYSVVPQSAPPKIDVWGNPVKANAGEQIGGTTPTDIAFRIFDPTNATYARDIDPIDRYIFNWNRQVSDPKDALGITPMGPSIEATISGKKVKFALTPEEQEQMNREAGQAARSMLGDEWDWKRPTEQGIERIKEVVGAAQRAARERMRMVKVAGYNPSE